jgi:hypothetical protein
MNVTWAGKSQFLTLALIGGGILNAAAAPAVPALEFNRDIRPILSENCYLCHGPDKSHRKAKLRLDVREAAVEKQAIVPGKPDESEVIKRIFNTDPDDVMPPPDTHKKLTAAQKETLKRWIAAGANYEPHWSYTPVRRAEPPAVKERAWAKNPVDLFILQSLEAKQLKPSAEADKRTLIRRLSLDLTGLPPTPEQLKAFLGDTSPKAYEKLVDSLLASPHYGERMAVPWLDLVRFSDTVGYHGDQNQNIFPYRDYVIEAFNQNKRFDQFTIEQIAGDLLPNPTVEQRIATGFNRLNMMTREGGAQPKEYLAKYAADRVRTVSTTWLGSTMGCSECHDHKFDPFSAKDFYAMAAFFSDVKQWGVYQDYAYTPNPDLKGFNNEFPFPPEIEVNSAYLQKRQERLGQRLREVQAQSATALKAGAPRAGFEAWQQASREFLKAQPTGWVAPKPEVSTTGAAKAAKAPKMTKAEKAATKGPLEVDTNIVVKADSTVVFGGKGATTNEVKLTLPAGWLAAIRLELLPQEQHTNSILRGGALAATLQIGATLTGKDGKPVKLAFYHADADRKDPVYQSGRALIGIKSGWKIAGQQLRSPQTGVWLLDTPRAVAEGEVLTLTLQNNLAGGLRVSVSPFAGRDPLDPKLGEKMANALKARDGVDAYAAYLSSTAWNAAAFAEYKKIYADYLECRAGRTPTLVTEAWAPTPMRVLPRGNWQDESGETVAPAAPHFLPQPANPDSHRLGRLDLARWLVAPENPLTARTFVNRLWKQMFGTGISTVVDDLGAQGEWPVHPELLDWLASEFMRSGWDVKHMVKLIALSATYRQDARLRPELKEIDPGNRLLASQTPRRLEAEFVRDNALYVAGLLNLDLGGPSAHPYQPAGYYANIQFPNRDYRAESDDRQYRRGVYAHWQRTFLHPMLANFDAPSREECTAIRTVSNTPQQALTLLNDPSFVEAARVFAARVLTGGKGSDREKLDRAFQQALARPAKAKEQESLLKFLGGQRAYYQGNAEDTQKLLRVGFTPVPAGMNEAELAAWTTVCRVILNLHETITRY